MSKKRLSCLIFIFTFVIIGLTFPKHADAYGVGSSGNFTNPNFQDVIYDEVYNRYEPVDWKVLSSSMEVWLDHSNGYPDLEGNRSLHYLPVTSPSGSNYWSGYMESVSNTYKSDYGQVLYGGSEKVYYVGNQPFIIAFREKEVIQVQDLIIYGVSGFRILS
ncbi:hypothetical protein [Alkalihalobacillus sp. AL-G]|uniref:hypothetical protein n=1 Tax=Alkalihalobacillus sp. AL-G TaxID=2926399 RepID=UPI00272B6D41|nr:hypothetical protein [Alkalihalobacillus sp. AL-G]WLD94053.1 hypothetical protein MOJ78_03905 [Alkalihalobacillus sp. AL-G]